MLNQKQDTQVLIVGAGPTGLTAAVMLTRLGIPVRIVEKNSKRSDKSKALGVQAGTLECLHKAIGEHLVQKMIESGYPTRDAWIHLNDQVPIRFNLSTLPSAYNFILILAQSETERILEEEFNHLSMQVERNTELIHIQKNGKQILSTLKGPSGEFQITSSFVIGCDGAHSTIRHLSGIPFHGAAYTGDFILGDVTMDWPWPYDSIRVFNSERGVIASFPMKGSQKYRLILIPKVYPKISPKIPINGKAMAPLDLSLEEFSSILQRLSLGQIRVSSSTWLTRFRLHHRMVKHFQEGRVFLAGDAAHIHSPVGGQGMNIGIQDALNLSFKLKRVLEGKAPVKFLKTYEQERLPVARNVVRATDLAFKMGLLPESLPVSLIRGTLLPHLVKSRFIQSRAALAISEIQVARREILNYE